MDCEADHDYLCTVTRATNGGETEEIIRRFQALTSEITTERLLYNIMIPVSCFDLKISYIFHFHLSRTCLTLIWRKISFYSSKIGVK